MTEIADNATTCPGCHAKYRTTFSMNPNLYKSFGIFAFATFIGWVGMIGGIVSDKTGYGWIGYTVTIALTFITVAI
jgi:hypothetical protein